MPNVILTCGINQKYRKASNLKIIQCNFSFYLAFYLPNLKLLFLFIQLQKHFYYCVFTKAANKNEIGR